MRTRPALAAITTLLALTVPALATGACTTQPTPPTNDRTRSTVSTATKTGTGDVRTDLEPLTKRFSALGRPVSATWMSGTLGGQAPGPSTYWIDAVVTLTPDAAASLRSTSPEPTTETPDVEDGVRSALPAGQLLHSEALDAKFAQGSFRARAYLAADSDTIVLVALGQ
jgi:hypothetical protein